MRNCHLLTAAFLVLCFIFSGLFYQRTLELLLPRYMFQQFSHSRSNVEHLSSLPNNLQMSDNTSTIDAVANAFTAQTHASTKADIKIIYGATKFVQKRPWKQILNLDNCKYQNCIIENLASIGIEQADVVMVQASQQRGNLPVLPWKIRQHQFWFVMTYESSGYGHNLFPSRYNNQFNGTMMWRRDSTVYYPWGKAIHRKTNQPIYSMKNTSIQSVHHVEDINFSAGKNKSAFVYLTNCGSVHYNRRALMAELSKYIPVDVFSNVCTGAEIKHSPCPRTATGANSECEENFNRPYRFFLAFENSLCKDYIDKLFDRLESPSYYLPVAMGGLSVDEYASIAPPDSFLHVNNFTSVKALGEYMKYLTENDEAYNRYHQWRYDYRITTSRSFGSCELCRLANEKPPTPAIAHIDQWFNDPKRCRKYNIH